MGTGVLIVEDQVLIAIHLQYLVEEAGYPVVAVAHDAANAVACAGQLRPAFTIMDLRLANGSSGLDAAREIYQTFGIRSLFVSANINEETRREATSYQALGFLGKPFLAAEVIAALHAAAAATASGNS